MVEKLDFFWENSKETHFFLECWTKVRESSERSLQLRKLKTFRQFKATLKGYIHVERSSKVSLVIWIDEVIAVAA